jgi:hypothetical protein
MCNPIRVMAVENPADEYIQLSVAKMLKSTSDGMRGTDYGSLGPRVVECWKGRWYFAIHERKDSVAT